MSDESASDDKGSCRNPIKAPKPDATRGGVKGWKRRCGAKTRKGTPCQRPPMAGMTRCRLHGGATPIGMASPHYKHGRRSRFLAGWPELPPREDG